MAATAVKARLSYWIDLAGMIVRLDGPWEGWLRDDGQLPERCSKQAVVGGSLFSFIEGEGVRWVYGTLQERVLETGRAIQFPFRCDSAWLRRDMRMTMTPSGDGIRYDSDVLRETRRKHPLPQPTAGASTIVAMCSFCKAYRFPVESKNWRDIELLFLEPGLPDVFSITHGMCDPCGSAWLRDFESSAYA